MSETIFNVNSDNFEIDVIEKSQTHPVLVDFWADWCQPCKQLMPLLEKIVQSMNGKLLLAKVNTDQEQQLAMHFGIRSLPTVLLFKQGQVVEQFSGVQTESEIVKLIEAHIIPLKKEQPSLDTDNLQTALELIQSGDTLAAIDYLKNESNLDGKLMLIKVLLGEGKIDEAFNFFDTLTTEEKSHESTLLVKTTLELIQQGKESSLIELQETITHIISVQPIEGIEKLLSLLKQADSAHEESIKKALILSFNLISDTKLVSQLRRKMAAIIF